MTEGEWLTATELRARIRFLQGKSSDRKLRLFAVACCRGIWHLIEDQTLRHAVEASERFADELITDYERGRAWFAASELPPKFTDHFFAAYAFADAAKQGADDAAEDASRQSISAIRESFPLTAWHEKEAAVELRRKTVDDLLRHIIGNPFRPAPLLPHVPTTVRELAEAVYQQEQAAVGPLRDALLDAGLSELADHFKDSAEWHPKGCWAVDLLTKRT